MNHIQKFHVDLYKDWLSSDLDVQEWAARNELDVQDAHDLLTVGKVHFEALKEERRTETLLELARRCLQALHEDDFPQLRQDLRDALEEFGED